MKAIKLLLLVVCVGLAFANNATQVKQQAVLGKLAVVNGQLRPVIIRHRDVLKIGGYRLPFDVGAYRISTKGCYRVQLEFYNVAGYDPVSSGIPTCDVTDPGTLILTSTQPSAYCLAAGSEYYVDGNGLSEFLKNQGHNPSGVNCLAVRSTGQTYNAGAGVTYAGVDVGFESGINYSGPNKDAVNTGMVPTGATTCLSVRTNSNISC